MALALIAGAAVMLSSLHGTARADDAQDLCKALDTRGAAGSYQVVDAQPITRIRDRPYSVVPRGVALLVEAPRGTTEADLQRDVAACRASSDGAIAKSDAVSVHRSGAHYVVKLTSNTRSAAISLANGR